MRPGKLDRKILIKTPAETRGRNGAVAITWETYATVWASVRYLSATERFKSDALHSAKVANFRIRYCSGIDPTMRIEFESELWKINGIAEIGRREGHDVTAELIQ